MPCWIKIHHTGSPAATTYIQGIHNGDFLGDEENIEAHHGDDEGYNIIRIIINEVGAILNIVLWESI